MQPTAERVGREVRAEMIRQGITRQTVGVALGISQSSLQRRLSGETPFNVNELVTVARVLRVPTASLLGSAEAA